jgi:hypothetical protein
MECHREYIEVTSQSTGESRVLREEKELCRLILTGCTNLHRAIVCIRLGSGFYLQANFKGHSEHFVKWSYDGPEFRRALIELVRSWEVDEIVVVDLSVLELIKGFNEVRLSRSLRMPPASAPFDRFYFPTKARPQLDSPVVTSPKSPVTVSWNGCLVGCGTVIVILIILMVVFKAC